MSAYNDHINELCTRYIDLWEGAEERADEEALQREEEIKRQLEFQGEPKDQEFDVLESEDDNPD